MLNLLFALLRKERKNIKIQIAGESDFEAESFFLHDQHASTLILLETQGLFGPHTQVQHTMQQRPLFSSIRLHYFYPFEL